MPGEIHRRPWLVPSPMEAVVGSSTFNGLVARSKDDWLGDLGTSSWLGTSAWVNEYFGMQAAGRSALLAVRDASTWSAEVASIRRLGANGGINRFGTDITPPLDWLRGERGMQGLKASGPLALNVLRASGGLDDAFGLKTPSFLTAFARAGTSEMFPGLQMSRLFGGVRADDLFASARAGRVFESIDSMRAFEGVDSHRLFRTMDAGDRDNALDSAAVLASAEGHRLADFLGDNPPESVRFEDDDWVLMDLKEPGVQNAAALTVAICAGLLAFDWHLKHPDLWGLIQQVGASTLFGAFVYQITRGGANGEDSR